MCDTLGRWLRSTAAWCKGATVFEASVPFEVTWGDVDPSGFIYYPAVFRYVTQAEAALWRSIGFSALSMINQGYSNPRVHVEADYHKPLVVDDVGTCRVWLSHIGRSSLRLDFALTKQGESEPAVTRHLVMVMIDFTTKQPAPIPDSVRQAIAAVAPELFAPTT
jgi:YbgC/YbaW family acyl-CoA thioester hydrolase